MQALLIALRWLLQQTTTLPFLLFAMALSILVQCGGKKVGCCSCFYSHIPRNSLFFPLQKRRTKMIKNKRGKKGGVKKQLGKKVGPKQPQGGIKQQQGNNNVKQQQQQGVGKQQSTMTMKKKDPIQAIRKEAVAGPNQQHQGIAGGSAAGVEVPNTVSEYNQDEEMPGITVSQPLIHALYFANF
jgi:hypothetical protein